MIRPRRKAALLCPPAVLAAAVFVLVASGTAAAMQRSAFPAKLVGTWTRTITLADVKRSHGYENPAGTVCTLTIKHGGAAHLACTGVGAWDSKLVPAGSGRIHIGFGDPTPGVYRWHVSGRLLTLTKLSDRQPDRVGVLWGVWKRK